ncbi:ATP-dependent DNA helicase [Halobacillus litoralis]|uniref:ATP-dependent DNA helicase n=1 Tax=Halobacillus litoralis TaxID=45668 RepID=UPI001CD1F49B|nr:ATP-dependent DNA helicase [Halobacillus litoralis]MCA0971176.1 ATP-dependent DNA helicase [Halobacillus litoralis]
MDSTMTISVRDLMSYIYRAGHIDNRFRSNTTLVEGTAIHQDVQKMYEEGDEKEVALEHTFTREQLTLRLQGRCDGLLQSDHGPVIDEIKSTARDLDELDEDSDPVYWAQAKGYAFIYADREDLEEIQVQLTYVQKQSKEKKRFLKTFSKEALTSFIDECIDQYMSYARIILHIREQKQHSIPDLSFPFPSYREGQRKLAGSVYRTIQEKRDLFAQAPTGIGKTISTLFPAVKAMDLEGMEKIYYLTAKTITRTTAEEALQFMGDKGLVLRSVTLTAKDKICFQDETICQPDYCEFADGYYDRINEALVDILMNETLLSRPVIESYAKKHKVCPFEFSLDLTNEADVIIGDYNYIYDPKVSLRRLLPDQKKKTTLLVDESHNLVERAREMYSAHLPEREFLILSEDWEYENERLSKAAEAIYKDLVRLRGEASESFVVEDLQGEWEESLERFLEQAERQLQSEPVDDQSEHLLDVYFTAQSFLRILELVDEHFKVIGDISQGEFNVKLFCLDPSHVLSETTKAFRSSVFFSATLSPFGYYKDMLGGKKDDYILQLPSPYDSSQIDLVVAPLSTRYKTREQTAGRLAGLLYEQVKKQKGNYLFFFPSYHYMDLVYQHFKQYEADVAVQEQGMDEDRREDFLSQFVPGGELVGFAVLGGIFSEGVDLRGDRLNGVAVVGIGLAPRSLEKELIKDYFQEKGRNGYDYAYVYPGMNKVLQAGGRLIRSESDQGSIQLIDDRFLTPRYTTLLPEDWGDYRIVK